MVYIDSLTLSLFLLLSRVHNIKREGEYFILNDTFRPLVNEIQCNYMRVCDVDYIMPQIALLRCLVNVILVTQLVVFSGIVACCML